MNLSRSISGTWKKAKRKVNKTFPPMIGIIYTGGNVVGMLVEDLGEVVILQTSEKERVEVLKKSLKIVASY